MTRSSSRFRVCDIVVSADGNCVLVVVAVLEFVDEDFGRDARDNTRITDIADAGGAGGAANLIGTGVVSADIHAVGRHCQVGD